MAIVDGIQSMIAGGSPIPNGGGFGDDPELIQMVQEALQSMSPEEIEQVKQMPPEQIAQMLVQAGVPEEEVGEAIEVLDMLLSQIGGGQPPIDVQGQQGGLV